MKIVELLQKIPANVIPYILIGIGVLIAFGIVRSIFRTLKFMTKLVIFAIIAGLFAFGLYLLLHAILGIL